MGKGEGRRKRLVKERCRRNENWKGKDREVQEDKQILGKRKLGERERGERKLGKGRGGKEWERKEKVWETGKEGEGDREKKKKGKPWRVKIRL